MSAELHTIIDFIRYGASRFGAAGLSFGHSFDNALDEATQLVLHALHLPHDTGPAYGQARLVADEKAHVLALFQRRIDERIPACYLTGEAAMVLVVHGANYSRAAAILSAFAGNRPA